MKDIRDVLRYPQKYILKEMFLDAMGEAPDSPRRGSSRGIHFKETFNSDDSDRSIDLFFLDERYNRDRLPCHIRREWCEPTLILNTIILVLPQLQALFAVV